MNRLKGLTAAAAPLALLAPLGLLISVGQQPQVGGAGSPVAFEAPELPRAFVDTSMPEQTGQVIRVPASGDLQEALDSAQLGDTVVLEAGATYTGTFMLPRKAGDGWIIVRSSAEEQLPAPGTRVKPDGGGVGWNAGLGSHIRGNSVMKGNTIIRVGTERAQRTSPKSYPDGNLLFDSFEAAGVDPETYRLLPDSPAKATATDGTDPGADIEAVMAATAGVRAESP